MALAVLADSLIQPQTRRFTLEEEGEQAEEQLGRSRYRLTREGPLRVFGTQEGGEDDEKNNIVGVTLANDGTVLLASKVRFGLYVRSRWTDQWAGCVSVQSRKAG